MNQMKVGTRVRIEMYVRALPAVGRHVDTYEELTGEITCHKHGMDWFRADDIGGEWCIMPNDRVTVLQVPGDFVGTALEASWLSPGDKPGDPLNVACGFVVPGPVTREDYEDGVVFYLLDPILGEYCTGVLASDTLTELSGCECGNPLTICHPDA